MVQASSFQRIMNVSSPVGGDNDHGPHFGLDGPYLRNGDLKIG